MPFANAQPICMPCKNFHYGIGVYYVTHPRKDDVCCMCGHKVKIVYMRLDPLKVKYPKVRKTTPRKKRKIRFDK